MTIRAVRFLVALLVVWALHFFGARWLEPFPAVVDLFLVLTVFFALGGGPVEGIVVGLLCGWAHDAVSGGPYGLFGIANTTVGYAVATASQRVVIQRTLSAAVVFALAAVVQQLVLAVLGWTLLDGTQLPPRDALLWRIATTAALGGILYALRNQANRRFASWRSGRSSKVRLGR